MRVLLVEDDDVLRDGLCLGLVQAGFTVDSVETFEDANDAIRDTEYDALVLDLTLPVGSGLDVLNRAHLSGRPLPTLLLTSRDGVRERIGGLDECARSDLSQPSDLRDVGTRLRALTNRRLGNDRAIVEHDGLKLDPTTLTVERHGVPLRLSRHEFVILHALLLQPSAVVSRARLKDRLYGELEEVESNAIEVHVHRLRSKLGSQVVRTIRGVGYVFGSVVS